MESRRRRRRLGSYFRSLNTALAVLSDAIPYIPLPRTSNALTYSPIPFSTSSCRCDHSPILTVLANNLLAGLVHPSATTDILLRFMSRTTRSSRQAFIE